MKQHGLNRNLLRIGRLAGKGAEAGSIRFVALLLGTLAAALGALALVAVHAAYEGQVERGTARGPVMLADAPGQTAKALWDGKSDSVLDSGPYSVFFISPLVADAPLPPGVSRWPNPGEAVLSPELLAKGAEARINTRYGRTIGTISAEGLQSPDELLVYMRPLEPLTPQAAKPIVAFGPSAGAVYYRAGQADYAKPEWNFQIMTVIMVLFPAGVLVVVAAQTGTHARDRRTALVEVLGGTSRSRTLVVVGEAWLAVTAGSALAVGVAIASCFVDVRLPWVGHVLAAEDMKARWWALLVAVVLAAVAVLATTVLVDRGRRGHGNRPSITRRAPTLWATVCPMFLLLAVRGPDLFDPQSVPYLLVNWVGVAGTLATLPAAIAVVSAYVGAQLGKSGRRWGRPGFLVAGRRMALHPGPIARMTAGVVIALGLVIQAVAWQGQFGDAARAAHATVDRFGTSALTLTPGGGTTEPHMRKFLDSLPSTASAASLTVGSTIDELTLQGPCPSLQALGLDCPATPTTLTKIPDNPRLRMLVSWHAGNSTLRVQQGNPPVGKALDEGDATTILISRKGEDLPVTEIKEQAYRHFPMGADVDTPGSEWLAGGQVNQNQGRWIAFFGFIGVSILAIAAGFTGLAELLRNGRALAPLTVLARNRRIYWSTAAHSVLFPLALAGLVGCFVGNWLAAPQTAGGASFVPTAFLMACAAAVAVMGTLAWVWGSVVSVQQAARWRPQGE